MKPAIFKCRSGTRARAEAVIPQSVLDVMVIVEFNDCYLCLA